MNSLVDSTGHALPAITGAAQHMAVQLDVLRWQALQQFDAAWLAMGPDLPTITKDGKIQIGGGKPIPFVRFEDLHNAVIPVLHKHGFYATFRGIEINGELWCEAAVHRNGASRESYWPVNRSPVNKAMNPNQATAAGFTLACRHALLRLLNLNSQAPEDRDTDSAAKLPLKTITEAQQKKLKDLIGTDEVLAALVENKWFKVLDCTVETFPADQVNGLLNAIKTYKARQKPQ